MIDKLGTDGVRLWVSSIDCSGEAVVSDVLLQNVQQVFRKIRNTCRFLLSNLYDFNHEKDALALDDLRLIDQYALQQLFIVNNDILNAYKRYDFTAVFHKLGDYCSTDLSSFYLDIIKDRLYVEQADGHARRSAQTSCYYVLDTLTKLMAPILSFTAEQVSDSYQKNKKKSIHLQQFAKIQDVVTFVAARVAQMQPGYDTSFSKGASVSEIAIEKIVSLAQHESLWVTLKAVRSALLKAIEELRAVGSLKHSLEARLTVFFGNDDALKGQMDELRIMLKNNDQILEDFFKEFVIVSQFSVAPSSDGLEQSSLLPGLFVKVESALGDKCPRCWNWDQTEHEHKLCQRCQKIVK